VADEAIPPGLLTYKWAALVAKFRVMPAQLAGLTDAQIDELLGHPRDKDGALKEPEGLRPKKSPTRAAKLAEIGVLEAEGLITPGRARELREEVDRGDSGR
jgi:hypothetical protein